MFPTEQSFDSYSRLYTALSEQTKMLKELVQQQKQQTQSHAQLTQPSQFEMLEEIKAIKRQLYRIENGPPQHLPIYYPPIQQQFVPYSQSFVQSPPYYQSPYYTPQPQYAQSPYLDLEREESEKEEKIQKKVFERELLKKLMKKIQIVDQTKIQSPTLQSQKQSFTHHKSNSKQSHNKQNHKQNHKLIDVTQKEPSLSQRIIKKNSNLNSGQRLLRDPSVEKHRQYSQRMPTPSQFRTSQPKLEDQKKKNAEKGKGIVEELLKLSDQFDLQKASTFIIQDCKDLFKKDIVSKQTSQTAEITSKICQSFLSHFKEFYSTITSQHKDLLKQIISTYLWDGHSKYVASRVKLNEVGLLDKPTPQQSQMLLMDYTYNQFYLPEILGISTWYKDYKNIPKTKEALKIILSVLHQLFVQSYNGIEEKYVDQPYNKTEILFFDFSKDINDIFQQSNEDLIFKGTIYGLHDDLPHMNSQMPALIAQFKEITINYYNILYGG